MGLGDIRNTKTKVETMMEKNTRQQVLFQWVKILFLLMIILGICYIVYGIANGIKLNPEIMGSPDLALTVLVASLFANVFNAFIYIVGISTIVWVVVGVINVFL